MREQERRKNGRSGRMIASRMKKPLFSEASHRVGFIHFQYHVKAFWQSNYKQSIIIERVPRWQWASLSHQSIYSGLQQLYNHIFVCFMRFFWFSCATGALRASVKSGMIAELSPDFGFVYCLLTTVMSGSLACWKTQSTVLLYCDLSTALSTGLFWHWRLFLLFKLDHIWQFQNQIHKYELHSVGCFFFVNATDFVCFLYFHEKVWCF